MRLAGSGAHARPAPTPRMPPGLVELMEGLTKNVLKNNPDDLYEFCAGHLQKLLEIRDGNPTKRKITLEQKIKKAQEKVRQKIQNRLLQENKMAKHSNETQELQRKESIKELEMGISIDVDLNNIPEKPRHHNEELVKTDGVEILHESNLTATTVVSQEQFEQQHELIVAEENRGNETMNEPKENCADNKDNLQINSERFHNEELTRETNVDTKHSKMALERLHSIEFLEYKVNYIHIEPVLSEPHRNVSSSDKIEPNKDDSMLTPSKNEHVIESEQVPEENFTQDSNLTPANNELVIEPEQVPKEKLAQDSNPTTSNNEQVIEAEQVPKENFTQDSNLTTSNNEQVIEAEQVPKEKLAQDSNLTPANNEQVIEAEQVPKEKLAQDSNLTPANNEQVIEAEQVPKEKLAQDSNLTPANNEQVIEAEQVPKEKLAQDSNLTSANNEQVIGSGQVQTPINQDVSSDTSNNLKPDKQNIDNGAEENSKEDEKELSLESETVERIQIFCKGNETVSGQKLKETLDSDNIVPLESTVTNELTQMVSVNDDIDKEVKKCRAYSTEKNATDVNYESRCNAESLRDNKKDSKQAEKVEVHIYDQSRPDPRLECKSPEVELCINNAETSTNTETQSRDENKIEDLSREIYEKVPIPDTDNIIEHSNSEYRHENGKNEGDMSKVDQNVIISAHQFLEHERQISSVLVMEEKSIISEKATLTASKYNKPGERDEAKESSVVEGMDLETAAITIQKVFRTFLFSKSRTSTLDDGANENSLDEEKKDEAKYVLPSANINKERRALGISRMDTVLQTVNEEKSLSQSTDDSSALSSAATTIQARVRGFLVRNKLASNKTTSDSSLINSDGPSTVSLDADVNEPKKTILNIHIVPERGQFISRDESVLTSIDLPLDNSPPSSVNLHPLGYDKSEPRKQLKREDAVQSVSPPSNSGKLSEEVDSAKDIVNENNEHDNPPISLTTNEQRQEDAESCDTTLTISSTADTVVDAEAYNLREVLSSPEYNSDANLKNKETVNLSSDEMDVVTPFPKAEKSTSTDSKSNEKPQLVHTGEFHDMVVQTQVKRSESSVVREFKNVLVYFLLWDKT